MRQENWKEIPEYEGLYAVSDLGRVKRIAGGQGARSGHILKPGMNGPGYWHVHLCKAGTPKLHKIHHLVMLAFVGSRRLGFVVNHKDGNKTNNTLRNLEYVTHQQNTQHAFQQLGHKPVDGERNGQSKLTSIDVANIKLLLSEDKMSQRAIGRQYQVSHTVIQHIAKGLLWKQIKDPTND